MFSGFRVQGGHKAYRTYRVFRVHTGFGGFLKV